jgi:hypothetical protein
MTVKFMNQKVPGERGQDPRNNQQEKHSMSSTTVNVKSAKWSESETRDGRTLRVDYSVDQTDAQIDVFLPAFVVAGAPGWQLDDEPLKKALFGYAKARITGRIRRGEPPRQYEEYSVRSSRDPRPAYDLPEIKSFHVEG